MCVANRAFNIAQEQRGRSETMKMFSLIDSHLSLSGCFMLQSSLMFAFLVIIRANLVQRKVLLCPRTEEDLKEILIHEFENIPVTTLLFAPSQQKEQKKIHIQNIPIKVNRIIFHHTHISFFGF